jgi:hypothetical protein
VELAVSVVQMELTGAVYNFVSIVQQPPNSDEDGARGKGRACLKSEERLIPEIIFHLEDFDKHLIQISSHGELKGQYAVMLLRAFNQQFMS